MYHWNAHIDKPKSNFYFSFMVVVFKLRDLIYPRANILKEVGIEPGYCVLDYGCGPGGYVEAIAQLVGESGRIVAQDIHPLAVRRVRNVAAKAKINNIDTICSDCSTGLPESSVDVVLLYDTFHLLNNPAEVLEELHRVLKPTGILSFSDHHMSENNITSQVTAAGLFGLSRRGRKTYTFWKK